MTLAQNPLIQFDTSSFFCQGLALAFQRRSIGIGACCFLKDSRKMDQSDSDFGQMFTSGVDSQEKMSAFRKIDAWEGEGVGFDGSR